MILSKYIRRARDVSRALLLGRREKNEFKPGRVYYSQCGEDAILRFIFTALKIPNPTYLEIGAYHPIELSNTYLFYCQGSAGLCVEPNPQLIEAFTIIRPRDICVQPVAAGYLGNVKFYIRSSLFEHFFGRGGRAADIPTIASNASLEFPFLMLTSSL
jgi:hypothetical protein